jgi:hypothetical protein
MPVRVQFTAITPKRRRRGFNDRARKQLTKFVHDWGEDIKAQLTHYPPVPTGSNYIRTERLKLGWKVSPIGSRGNIGVAVYNRVPYTQYVHGTPTDPYKQRYYHGVHGWRTIVDILADMGGRETFRKEAQNVINHAIGGGIF